MGLTKVIGGPISGAVKTQINVRQSIYSSNKRREDPQVLQFMNSRTGWVKLQSSVNVNGSSNLAKEYILIGGVLGRTGIDTYRDYPNGLGFRPMPGITGVEIRSLNRFGAIKEANITLNCWDLKQLADIEQLFMRPGYTALLEWGHSLYYTNSNAFSKEAVSVNNFFSPGASKESINAQISKIRSQTSNNYDGIFGLVKNFSWSYRSDGGYDCMISLITVGEVIESTPICIGPSSLGDITSIEEDKPQLPTLLETILKVIKDNGTECWSILTTSYPNFTTKYQSLSGLTEVVAESLALQSVDREMLSGTEQKFTYIRMDTFCGILNTILLVENGNLLIKLNTQIAPLSSSPNPNNIRSSRFRNYSKHVSSDPGICLIITPSVDDWLKPLITTVVEDGTSLQNTVANPIQAPVAFEELIEVIGNVSTPILGNLRRIKGETSSNEILNIWLNVDFIASQVSTLVQEPQEERTLVNLMNPILSQINEALGGINELALHYEEESFTWYIVDRSVQVSKNNELPIFDMVGLKSTASEISLITKLSKDTTTMMAISAQANAADLGVEVGSLLEWNKGLTDRVIKTKSTGLLVPDENTSEQTGNQQKILQEKEFLIKTFLDNVFNRQQYNYDEAAAARTAYQQYTTSYLQYYDDAGAGSADTADAGPAGIIPFEINITMDGISGIKIGEAFRITDGSLLPSKYDGISGFLVTGVDHDITANRWTTKLKAQLIVLKKSAKVKVIPKPEVTIKYTPPPETPRQPEGDPPPSGGRIGVKSILFVGDSITAGPSCYPKYVKTHFTGKIEVDKLAIGGKRSEWMREVLPGQLRKQKYDMIFIYGGINDAFASRAPSVLVRDYQKLINMAANSGAKVVAITGYDAKKYMIREFLQTTSFVPTKDGMVALAVNYQNYQAVMASQLTNCYVLPKFDIATPTSGDGIHPGPDDHKRFAKSIIKYIESQIV